ncbi:F-box/kelch-repeat protein At3g06240-like [Telopea speciosissima]|uniref:F-box/kelch-repeat protein At3g06240-like n=1 Tax=Telopea speciosissima TaxID=54955 RepID=UPI001CC4012A|nr:F-box/kelch-repeat protein At3g06240-like [Telopea speciosissima]
MEKETQETKKQRKETRSVSASSARTTALLNLPIEIKDKILLSLPVEALLRFRCVIRDYSRFHNPHFIKMHLNRQIEINNGSTIIIANGCKIYKVDLGSFSNPIPLDIPFLNPTHASQLRLAGSCNGLLCLTDWDPYSCVVYLWNPATGGFKQLPSHNYIFEGESYNCVLGFGYDHISGKFKVLARRTTCLYRLEAIVYTLGASSWRSIGELKYYLLGEKSQVFGGCLHWIVRDSKTRLDSIVSFSVENEKFKEIPMPPNNSTKSLGCYTTSCLTALGGRLSIFYIYYSGFKRERYELWVKMDDGLENTTWTKQLSFNLSDIPPHINGYGNMWGFKDGQVLLEGPCRTLALFNPVNGHVTTTTMYVPAKRFVFKLYSYIEGLGMLMDEDREDVHQNS